MAYLDLVGGVSTVADCLSYPVMGRTAMALEFSLKVT